MSSANSLHASLLRPTVLHVLRASGFHSARPSALDSLTDLCARYLLLLVQNTASHAYDRHFASADGTETDVGSVTPTLTDVRLGLVDSAFFTSTLTPSEENWLECMRKPLADYPIAARDRERRRRNAEDTKDVQEFVDWATGVQAREMRRVAAMLPDEFLARGTGTGLPPMTVAPAGPIHVKDDFLTTLKKKHGKSGEGARYNGTVLGTEIEMTSLARIEGGPSTMSSWHEDLKRKREHSDPP